MHKFEDNVWHMLVTASKEISGRKATL